MFMIILFLVIIIGFWYLMFICFRVGIIGAYGLQITFILLFGFAILLVILIAYWSIAAIIFVASSWRSVFIFITFCGSISAILAISVAIVYF